MKKIIVVIMPFSIMPIFVPLYIVLDKIFFVEIFGCGCVPFSQTNMLNIPFNANDLRKVVFFLLTIGVSVWSLNISKMFKRKVMKFIYCLLVVILNGTLALWVVKNFMWA